MYKSAQVSLLNNCLNLKILCRIFISSKTIYFIQLWSLSEVSEDKEECRCPCSTCCYVEPGDGDQWQWCDIRRCVDWPPCPALRSQQQTAPTDNAPPVATVLRLQCCRPASSTRSQLCLTSIGGLQVLLSVVISERLSAADAAYWLWCACAVVD